MDRRQGALRPQVEQAAAAATEVATHPRSDSLTLESGVNKTSRPNATKGSLVTESLF